MPEKRYLCPSCHVIWYYIIEDRDEKVTVPDCPKCSVALQREATA